MYWIVTKEIVRQVGTCGLVWSNTLGNCIHLNFLEAFVKWNAIIAVSTTSEEIDQKLIHDGIVIELDKSERIFFFFGKMWNKK